MSMIVIKTSFAQVDSFFFFGTAGFAAQCGSFGFVWRQDGWAIDTILLFFDSEGDVQFVVGVQKLDTLRLNVFLLHLI